MPQLPCEQGSELWFTARRGRITASLAAACLRLSPHGGPLGAYRQIMGITDRQGNSAMQYGMRYEEEARQAYWHWSGKPEIQPGGLWVHPQHDWLAASPDGLIGAVGLLEVKCPMITLPTEVPLHHDIQCRIQMACCQREWVDYFAWFCDSHFHQRIERDEVRESILIAELHDFCRNHVAIQNPPPMRAKRVKEKA